MAAPQGNPGRGMFGKYTGEQVNQIPAGYVEGMGSMGRAYAQIGQTIGNALVGMAGEYQKQDMAKAQAQGLLDSYTGGDVESAMYRDDTPTHVKSFLDRSFSAGGVDKMSQRDINAFLAGEQAYGTQLDRRLKERQVATGETKAAADAAAANDPLERFNKSAKVAEAITSATSPGIRTAVISETPSTVDFFNQGQREASAAAGQKVKDAAKPKIDLLRDAYNTARADLDRTSQSFDQAAQFDVPTEELDSAAYSEQYMKTEEELQKSRLQASTKLAAIQSAEAATNKAAAEAGIQALGEGFTSPQRYEQAKVARREAILAGIREVKTGLSKQVAARLGPEAASLISITKDDEEFAAKMAAEIPDGTVIQSGEGYAWVYEGGKAVFKTAKQMGMNAPTGVVLPADIKLDYGKPFAGMSQEAFVKLDPNTQKFISTETKKHADLLLSSLTATQKAGEIASSTLTPLQHFGWSGYIGNDVILRKVVDMTTGRRSIEFSIDQILKTYDKFKVSRAWTPEARAVFNATRPVLISSVRPMVAGGNQQSDTELRTILASLPMGENLTSIKDYDVAQYRFMKIMFARHYDNYMSSIPNLKRETIGSPMDYSSLPKATKDLVDEFATGRGQFNGMDGLQRMSALQTILADANNSGKPYLDSAGAPILVTRIDRSAFDADSLNGYVQRLQAELTEEQKAAARLINPGYNALEGAISPR
jgi:hypothetical protein